MKIGILITSISNFGVKGFYNSQEIGLAKAFSKFAEKIFIYKCVPADSKNDEYTVNDINNLVIHNIPTKSFGINGLIDTSVLNTDLDVLIYFSDTQLSVVKVYKWAQQNEIMFFPYIGVTESHSNNKIIKIVIDALAIRNFNIYKKCTCFVKTPAVKNALAEKGVNNCIVTPVGLDLDLLKKDFADTPVTELKSKYGYTDSEKILLFIGRMTDEKQPFRMIDIFNELYKRDNSYRLIMVGVGELLDGVKSKANCLPVKFIDKIPNSDIWELYRIADAFINLNQQEIFGMAILEAMYYGCKVVAWKAPGPEFIIEDGVSGILVSSNEELIDKLEKISIKPQEANKRICENFVWDCVAEKIIHNIEN